MGMNYEEFKSYIKQHGVTKTRTTCDWNDIPQGTILFFGTNKHGKISTYSIDIENKNKDFGYKFDYCWDTSWECNYGGTFELVDKQETAPSKDVTKMKTKKIYEVLVVNKKTGKTEKHEILSADNEQQAILKTFGVDAENTFIKATEVGSYEEEKPIKAVLEKPEKPAK